MGFSLGKLLDPIGLFRSDEQKINVTNNTNSNNTNSNNTYGDNNNVEHGRGAHRGRGRHRHGRHNQGQRPEQQPIFVVLNNQAQGQAPAQASNNFAFNMQNNIFGGFQQQQLQPAYYGNNIMITG